MLNRASSFWARLDWITVGVYFLLVFLGWLNIYAAVYDQDHQNIFDISQKYGMQLLWIGASVILIIMIFLVDSRFYAAFPYPIYALVLILLLLVLAFGKEVNGAKSWIDLGLIRLQPAEFAKLSTALALAKFTSTYNFKLLKFRNLLIVGAIMFTPSLLILLQNDTGSALVYSSLILVLYREGLPGWVLVLLAFIVILFILTLLHGVGTVAFIILGLMLLYYYFNARDFRTSLIAFGILLIAYSIPYAFNYFEWFSIPTNLLIIVPFVFASIIFVYFAYRKNINRIYSIVGITLLSLMFILTVDYGFNNVLIQHQRDRINNLLGIEFDPLGAGYNVNQSLIAIGSGGFSGKGYLQGTQTKYDFVPEQSTDFIFCTVGEEWGFLGTSSILLLFTFLLIRILIIAERQKSSFTRIYAYGVASIFFFHLIINVGMTIGLAPVIGIPLPFFSYGGSSLWAFTILLFILLRLDVSRDQLLN
ncbi:MAG: rod shape-determining protein RodA [Bacteroidales bacterium]|nr:rod shape-determining protein RodA [Bacteroidales bacterium]